MWRDHSQLVSTYQHCLPVIALAFSSSTDQLASASSAELALWSPGDSPVERRKVCLPEGLTIPVTKYIAAADLLGAQCMSQI